MKTTDLTPKQIRAKFNRLEAINNHTGATILLVKHFGTEEEMATLLKIQNDVNKRGFIDNDEIRTRYEIMQKYWKYLLHLCNS